MITSSGNVDAVSHLIQLSVAPVFLLAGMAGVLAVLSSRLSRIVDKVERLKPLLLSKKLDGVSIRVDEVRKQRRFLERRAHNMNLAIVFCTLTGFLVALVIIVMFLSAFFEFHSAGIIAGLFITGMFSFIFSLIGFLRELYLSNEYMKKSWLY